MPCGSTVARANAGCCRTGTGRAAISSSGTASPAWRAGSSSGRRGRALVADRQDHGELEGVGEQVLQHLARPRGVGADARRQRGVALDAELQPLVVRELAEAAIEVVADLAERRRRDVERGGGAGLDLRQVEKIVDQ